MRPEYFEGTLQLRNVEPKVLDYVKKLVEDREGVHIASTKKVKGGYDLALSSQKFMQILGKKLQHKYGGKLSISRKLFSRNRTTSKAVYRLTVLFKQSHVKKNQRVQYKGEEYKVILLGHKVRIKNQLTGKSITVDYDDLCFDNR